DAVEAHGTGTPLGDPIEINGLKKAFAQLGLESSQPHCALSAVKTNIGHLESAAGMAGIIKVVMAMKHRQIPAIRNFEKLNPYIELENSPFFIATETTAWEPEHPRRAGVSSFGMGGVNAHVVLEEAPAMNAGPAEEREYVFPLSAKKGRLTAYAGSLAKYVAQHRERLSLGDVAYTLQHGRDLFDERLSVVASSADELVAKLERYVATGVAENTKVEWNGSAARRIPLPTYPFARKRCWFTDVPSRAVAVTPAAQPERFTRTLRPTDFFIRDHVVQGKPMLPGVAHLEFARAAGQRVRIVKDVYWLTPVVVEEAEVSVEVRLTTQKDGVGFELLQGDTVHSKGILVGGDAQSLGTVDLDGVRSRCTAGTGKAALYATFQQHGLAYGRTFQVIEHYVENDREILAELQLPAEAAGGDFFLHPSIMDGVFQTVTALSLRALAHTGKQFVPFHLEAAEIGQPAGGRCPLQATVHATINGTSFDATLTDADGNVLVRVRNLQKRAIAVLPQHAEPRDSYYGPVWRRKEQAARANGNLLLVTSDADAIESFKAQFETVIAIDPLQSPDYEGLLQEVKPTQVAWLSTGSSMESLFDFTQAALKAKLRENVRLVFVHPVDDPIGAMVAGFARTLKYENPKFDYVSVGVDDLSIESIARIAATELALAPAAHPLREIAYRAGQRFERTVIRETIGETAAPPIRTNGVYVITGGAGGLGSVFSRHLAEKHQATLLWLGRSPMSPAIAGKIAAIESLGGKCHYFSVDITDREALARTLAEARTAHGAIHGVIHAAGLIEDSFILRKQKESFARVVEPKVLGATYLDELTKDDILDFFVVFSSIAALMPNQGQCDYAAANSFLDRFVELRNRLVADEQRTGVSLAMNWPLWANGGMRVTAEEERHLLHVFGMKPLPTAEGLQIFETSLALAAARFPELHQVIAIDGDREKIERSLGVTADASEPSLEAELKSIFATRLGVTADKVAGNRTIGELGVDSLRILGVIQDINQRFGAGLKPTLLFDLNTVDKLAAHLTAIGKDKIVVTEAPRWNRSLIDVAQSDPARRTFRRTFRTSEFYLRDHVVDGQYNMPGACYVEMARQAGDLLLGDKAVTRLLHNYWASPLSSPADDFSAEVILTPKQEQFAYEVVSYTAAGEKRLHAMGQLTREAASTAATIDVAAIRARCTEVQKPERIYAQIHGEGLMVGPTFEPMSEIFLNDDEALAMLALPEEIGATAGDYVLNPALLTGAFQTALISNRRVSGNSRQYIPIGMDELEVLAPIPAECCIYSRPRAANARNEEMRKFDVEICRTDGTVVVRLKGFSIRALKTESHSQAVVASASPRNDGALLTAVQELIKSKLAGPIGLSAGEIDLSVPFDQYGVTSVMVVELNQIFEEIVGPMPKTLFFEYRNVAELAEYFVENHGDVLTRLEKASNASTGSVSISSVEPIEQAREYLRALIAGPIGLAPEEIDVHTGFDQYGVNSVMVVELNERFEKVFGPLSKTLFFEYRSVDELARYFLDEHRDALSAALPRASAPVAEMAVAETPVQARIVEERHDIAIVSAAGRFPGARTLEEFWQLLKEGRDCITEIPDGRFDYRRHYDENPEHNRIYAKWGGFIDDVDRFDPAFFNISPREAELLDPQERLLLEVVWEMMERAGYTRQRLHRLSDRRVGVFVGALWQPYESLGVEATLAGDPVGPSSLLYSIANRVSYYFDLSGPSMAIDTACSSSLTALHLACQSIRDGESQFAIAAGVNLSLTTSKYLFLSRYRFLSTDGRCRSYGAGGDGYVPGEGICAVLLKPLAKAIADGDQVLGVIKGSALNHGGRTNGYTVPNPKSQGNVIATALENGRVDPRSISYIEGHGTGTSLGDPIEIAGLQKALGLSKDGNRTCAIGSVKSNIGHLEAAAGLASVIKVLLQMKHRQLAPSIHSDELNPNIDFERSCFRVQRELAPWNPEQGTRRAGVSSFGAGGSNAHVILEDYDGPTAPALQDVQPALCVFSAKSEERLFELVRRFDASLDGIRADQLHEIAWTLQAGREAMRERLAVVATSVDELRAALAELLERKPQTNWR
ncbi:MAG TPA: SDR family NAD(P)-dependent oxidoreductase, partial [Thermoanaerobaculia bacterium]